MHPRLLSTIVTDLLTLGEAMRSRSVGTVQDQVIFEEETDAETYRKVLNRLAQAAPWGQLSTRPEVNRLIQDLIKQAEAGISATDLGAGIVSEEQKLQAQPARLVVLPVSGVYTDKRFQLGAVQLIHLSLSKIKALARLFVGTSTPASVIARRAAFVKSLTPFENLTVALYSGLGSDARVRSDAVRKTRQGLHLLRAMTLLLQSNPQDIEIAVSGDERVGGHIGLVVQASGVSVSQQPLEDVIIDDLWITHAHPALFASLGFDLALPFPARPLNSWEQTVRQVLQWIGNAQQSPDPETAFLSVAIALEILFTGNHQSVSSTLADGVAFLTSSGVPDRLERRKEIKELYDLRSSISHGRIVTTVGWPEVNRIALIARQVLRAVVPISGHWHNRSAFENHLDGLKYS